VPLPTLEHGQDLFVVWPSYHFDSPVGVTQTDSDALAKVGLQARMDKPVAQMLNAVLRHSDVRLLFDGAETDRSIVVA
jgi:hypothetical protein